MNVRIRTLWIALMAALLGPTSLAMAGSYYAYSSVDTYVDVANGPNSSFSITPGTNQTRTGSVSGNAYFSNNVTDGLLNSLPPPLFPGVYNTSQTNGFADLNSPGSSANSSISNESEVLLFLTKPTLLAFDVVTSTTTTVQTTSPYEFTACYADVNVYFDGTQVYSTYSTAGSFGNGFSYTTSSGGDSPLIYVLAHAGVNELDSVTHVNCCSYTIAPQSVPEPRSLVLGIVGTSMIGLCLLRRRRQGDPLKGSRSQWS